eukprot:403371691
MKLIFLVLSFMGTKGDEIITCPSLRCDGNLDVGQCAEIGFNSKINGLYGQSCNYPDICPIDVRNGSDYAWIDEYFQQQTTANSNLIGKGQSAIKQKKTQAYCTSSSAFMQDLRPGRECNNPSQCKSVDCNNGICQGLELNQFCNSHDDCSAGMFCQDASSWPFESRYRKLNLTKCLPMFSNSDGYTFGWSRLNRASTDKENLILEDFEQNGKYCQSGLAHPIDDTTARCSKAANIFGFTSTTATSASQLQYPYKCSPLNLNRPCKIYIDTTSLTSTQIAYTQKGKRGFVEVFCRCSLSQGNNQDNGYCGSVIGTDMYRQAMSSTRNMLEKSICHTLDRNDIRAQRESCGVGSINIDQWKETVDRQFNVTHWPYLHDDITFNFAIIIVNNC